MGPCPRLQLTGIRKSYPGCVANDGIDLRVEPGEIHALLGENGAGKSTLMKIIYGVVKPDAGVIRFGGQVQQIQGPAHARELGIGMVFQHFSLFETLTVAENIALGLPAAEARDMAALGRRISEVGSRYGMALDPQRHVHSLSIGERQRVEILRCLLQDIKLLILDEPTSVLTPQEVDSLFQTLRQLASEGCSILFISHKLKEVQALCHEATVLRAGKVSGHCQPAQTSTDAMARMMVGDDTPLAANFSKAEGGDPFLVVKDLSHSSEDPFGTSLKHISFDVRRGEILGIAGVAGNGQEELLTLLSGEALSASHSVCFNGQPVGHLGAQRRRGLGLGFVPEERLGRGAVPDMSLRDNALLTGFLFGLVRHGWILGGKVKTYAEQIRSRFKVKCGGIEAQAKSLSGGNLQKFIIGREILQNPKLLICSHPTWGVDVGAAMLIHSELIALRDRGCALLVVSEDIDELYEISDRICALCDGQLSPIKATADTSITELGRWMAGHFEAGDGSAPQPPSGSHTPPWPEAGYAQA